MSSSEQSQVKNRFCHFIEWLLGWITGTLVVYSLSALSSTTLLAPDQWLDGSTGVHGVLDFIARVIEHGSRRSPMYICLLFALVAVTLSGLLALFRPLSRYRFFIAGSIGAALACCVFIWQCDMTWDANYQFYAQNGSRVWKAKLHHQSMFHTVEDEIDLLYLARVLVVHLDAICMLLITPVICAFWYGRKNKTGTVQFFSKHALLARCQHARIPITTAFVALIIGAAMIAVGGIGLPRPEPPWVRHLLKEAIRPIPAGTVIDESMVGDYAFYGLPDDMVPNAVNVPAEVADPIGRYTIVSMDKGQIFTENCLRPKEASTVRAK